MAELNTKINTASVNVILKKIENKEKRADRFEILKFMQQITRQEPKMWGSSIIGFGNMHNEYESGREGDWFITGFSPRKQNLTLYVMGSFNPQPDLLKKLGKHKTGSGCLYIKKLKDIDLKVLKEPIKISFNAAAKK